MQLKGKKVCIFTTILVYCATFLLQSNFMFFQTWAQEKNIPRVNIVAVLVDNQIYNSISSDVEWYASDYIQGKLADTKALVLPLDLNNIKAYDIYRMMENIYFDGLENVNSSLIGLVMIGDIPFPVVNQDGYIFPTVYPYVDFENQKYVWDEDSQYFVPNGNPGGQAEIWHGLINYGADVQAYSDYFQKIKNYVADPDNYIGDSIWYEDFVAEKEGFIQENYQYYKNAILFAEDIGYQRFSPLMKKLMSNDSLDNAVNILSEIPGVIGNDEEMQSSLSELQNSQNNDRYTTKAIQQEIQDSFLADYNELFSSINLSTMRENVLAGGRRTKQIENSDGQQVLLADVDNSASMIQLKDTLNLGNENLEGLIQNWNDLLEEVVDKKIESENYDMDIVVPVYYEAVDGKRSGLARRCNHLTKRRENYYFGQYALYIDNPKELSIYRGTYRNLEDLARVTYSSLKNGYNPSVSQNDKTDTKLKSVGSSYDIFSSQTEGNRGYTMLKMTEDLDTYNKEKQASDWYKSKLGKILSNVSVALGKVKKIEWTSECDDDKIACEGLSEFSLRWWGGASAMNLKSDDLEKGRYVLSGYTATDAWRTIYDMGGFQKLLTGDYEGDDSKGWIDGLGKGAQKLAANFKSYIKYASPTQKMNYEKKGLGYIYYTNKYSDSHIDFSEIDYWHLASYLLNPNNFKKLSDKSFSVSFNDEKSCNSTKEYVYKFLDSVIKHNSTTDDEINGIDRDKYGEFGTLGRYYSDIKKEYEKLDSLIDSTLVKNNQFLEKILSGENTFEQLRKELAEILKGKPEKPHNDSEDDSQLAEADSQYKSEIHDFEMKVNDVLGKVLENAKKEKDDFENLYEETVSLSPASIMLVLSNIVYEQGGNPDDYLVLSADNLSKIPFLDSWQKDIYSMQQLIPEKFNNNVKLYREAFDSLNKQVNAWKGIQLDLSSMGLDFDDEEVNQFFNGMFKIISTGDNDGKIQTYTEILDKNSVNQDNTGSEDGDPDFIPLFQQETALFNNLIQNDLTGNEILKIANLNIDFQKWLDDENYDKSVLSDGDSITLFSQRVKGDGYGMVTNPQILEVINGATEHLSGMNILTSDRPIDSPRYVTMQSVAGNDISLIYPNLFKVEVFDVIDNKSDYDVHGLKSVEDIKSSLEKYLRGKVDEYNSILESEKNQALKFDVYFSNIQGFNSLATPTLDSAVRPYGEFTYADFFNALGGDSGLEAIAEVLYYQNLTNVKKQSSETVSEDLDFLKESFSLNDKRKYVLENYLKLNNEKSQFVIPTYQTSGYEVAFVNSDGGDYIIPSEESADEYFMQMDLEQQEKSLQGNDGIDGTKEEQDFNDECDIPTDGRVLLFDVNTMSSPWLKAFNCRWKHTLQQPMKLRLTFDNALGTPYIGSGFEGLFKSYGKELSETFTTWGDSMKDHFEAWDSIFEKEEDKSASQAVNQLSVEAEKRNQEVIQGAGEGSALMTLNNNIRIKSSNSKLTDVNTESELKISSLVDLGNISVEITSTGDSCLALSGMSVCGGAFHKTFNPFKNPLVLTVTTSDHIAGASALDLKFSFGGKVLEKVVQYYVSPSFIEKIELTGYDEKTVAGMLTPFNVIATDKYGNNVDWSYEDYDFVVSTGKLLKDGMYQTGFTTKDFKNLKFKYQAPLDASDGDTALIQIFKSTDLDFPILTHPQPLLEGKMEVKLNNETILKGDEKSKDESIRLTADETIYQSDGKSVDISKLQKLDIFVNDSKGNHVAVDSQILVTSKNGLVKIGTVEKDKTGTRFVEMSLNALLTGQSVIYYYPTKVAGNDVITIEIPGLDPREINLSILPAPAESVQITTKDNVIYVGESMDAEIRVADHWGNLVDKPISIFLGRQVCPEDKSDFKVLWGNQGGCSSVLVNSGYQKISLYGQNPGVEYFTVNMPDGTPNAVNGYVKLTVDGNVFPTDDLNIMYLNYFGNDWGNQRGYLSKNHQYIENIMKKSDKIITTTTQLVSEEKIKQMIRKIQPGFKIMNMGNVDTKLSIQSGNINIIIGNITTMNVKLPSFEWLQIASQDSLETTLQKISSSDKNYVFFIPSSASFSLKDGVIYSGADVAVNVVGGDVVLSLSDLNVQGYNVWQVSYKGVNYGYIVFRLPNLVVTKSEFSTPGQRYFVDNTFSNGSTDDFQSIGIFDGQSDFELNSSYKSIQNSKIVSERIGFLGDFKNITLFAEGENVGEATKKFGSEFVINLGDPVLSRKSSNAPIYGSKFDGGIGMEIFSDSENDIFGTYPIDFNNDGLQDLLVIYLDGTIKLSKNYGSASDLREMQELMRIAVGIENAYVGDVDGNKYDDIIIRTSNNQLRAYLNNGGIFDVDGTVVCLNAGVTAGISDNPSNIKDVYQLFVEDMDLDGTVDIITNDDKGKVKVFYGGSTNGYGNYLSTEKYACDTGWYSRQESNTITVTSLGLNVSSEPVYDNSMIRWVGLTKPDSNINEDQLNDYIDINPDDFTDDNISKLIKANKGSDGDSNIEGALQGVIGNFNVDDASTKFVEDYARYNETTLYESDLIGGNGDNYVFIPISFLDKDEYDDPVSVYKTYSSNKKGVLVDGDIVNVVVTIKANKTFVGTFGDIIQGPWRIYFDNKNVFKGIKFISNEGKAEIKQKDGNFAYLIDKISLSAGQTFQFSYNLEYAGTQLRDIDITHETFYSNDEYPDIKVKCMDGCVKDFDAYINGGKSFTKTKVELQKMIDDYYNQVDEDTHDYQDDLGNLGSNINALPGIIGDTINRVRLLDSSQTVEISDDKSGKDKLLGILTQGAGELFGIDSRNDVVGQDSLGFNLDLNIFEEQTNQIESMIDDITKGMCNGFEFGGSNTCKGLPVPFNQAFLAPGKYHLFGCRNLPLGKLESGLPIFFFPGTLHAGPYEIPIPDGLKSPLDSFIWIGGGNPMYTSWIRIYAAPTLTNQLGLAICLGNEKISKAIPSPLADVAGNCVVLAIKPQCNKKSDGGVIQDSNNPNETYEDFIEEVRDSGTCNQSQKGIQVLEYGKSSSPLLLEEYHTEISIGKFGIATYQNNSIEYSAQILGGINMEIDPVVGADDSINVQNSIMIGGVDVLGGDFNVNKIKGGLQQGIRNLLIDKWLDPQIRYIANQLTKMHVTIKFPDFSGFSDEVEVIKDAGNNVGSIMLDGFKEIRKDRQDVIRIDTKSNGNTGLIVERDKFNNGMLKDLNKDLANPFEALASLMNQSNIMNIHTETLTVKVPMVFAEDINAYEIYLKQWVDVNSRIVEEWTELANSLGASCEKIEEQDCYNQAKATCDKKQENEQKNCYNEAKISCDNKKIEEQQACYKQAQATMAGFVEFQGTDWQKTLDQVNRNILILQEYRNFPFEMYERVHVIDRYMSEIMSLLNDTIGYLSYWMQTNAGRFSGYVDAIVLIMNIIKTYQLIIDFSVNWSEKCGNCAEDTYDQYSCKLSMLCDAIELPIIQIPNFKIPNITLDLSDIDLGLDIVLPEFNFQPVRIDLPDIPNLPEPPTIAASIKMFDLPDIPELPAPPELPELPSFIPEVEMELPILPPAPELPKVPTEIEGIINVADLIGKIYCIVKGKFGLVGEKSVKAKIEQLTQRTYEVPRIDNIMNFTNLSAAPVRNYGVDYEISTYVDLQFNFDDVYNLFDTMTDHINNFSTNVVAKGINEFSDSVSDKLQDVADHATVPNIDVNVDLSMNTKNLTDIDGLTSDEIEYTDYTTAKNRLQEVLTYFRGESSKASFKDKYHAGISKIENQISKENVIKPNQNGLEEIQNSALSYLDSQKSNYDKIAELINDDYAGFLAMISQSEDMGGEVKSKIDKSNLAFNLQLFNIDSSTKETLENIREQNPYEDLLENKHDIVDGYWNAINSSTAESLGLTDSQYLVLRTNIGRTRQQINSLYSVVKPVQTTKLVAKNGLNSEGKTLIAAANVDLGDSTSTSIAVDPSGYANGIYDTILDSVTQKERKTKVVNSETFVNLIGNNYYFTKRVIGKGLKNIILWNEKAVYLKTESERNSGKSDRGYYVADCLKEIPYAETRISLGNGTKLKIADENIEVKNRKVQGQTYDDLSFSWSQSDGDNVDGYLIKMVDRIDYSYEKADYTKEYVLPRYVLVVPNGVDESMLLDYNLEIIGKKDTIQNLIDGGELSEIVHYDIHKPTITAVVSEIDKKWMYARITTLHDNDGGYEINAPWSNQIVAGKQIIGDDQGPAVEAQLYRAITSELVDEGDNLEGYVGTWYTLNVIWKDNVALTYANLSENGKILMEENVSSPTITLSLSGLFKTGVTTQTFNTMAIDQYGNKAEKTITISYNLPDVTIVDVSRDANNEKVANITAELSQDIDEGTVTFQRNRGNSRKNLVTIDNKIDFELEPHLKTIIGTYTAGTDIALYDSDGATTLALMNPETGEISIKDEYKDKVDILVDVNQSVIIRVNKKSDSKFLFEISLPLQELVKVEVSDKYSVSQLPEDGNMGMYNGGKAVYVDGNVILLISPTGHMYSELGLEGKYEYDKELQAIKFVLYEMEDLDKLNPISIRVKVEPYVK